MSGLGVNNLADNIHFPIEAISQPCQERFWMVEICTDNLAALQKQEAELLATLEAVRQAIQAVVSKLPAKARGGTKKTPQFQRN
jgi:hypothetical protein